MSLPPTAVCNQAEIRLQDGQFVTEGRVEICNLEVWNTVCDIQWTNEDASVVCKQIGFSRHSESILITLNIHQWPGLYALPLCHSSQAYLTLYALSKYIIIRLSLIHYGVKCYEKYF